MVLYRKKTKIEVGINCLVDKKKLSMGGKTCNLDKRWRNVRCRTHETERG